MGTASRNSSWRLGVLFGLGLTAVGMLVVYTGWLDSLGLTSLDIHLRAAEDRPVDDRIVLIDIDDASLETVGDWPWARRRYAQLIRALSDAGAKAIVLDIVLSDPSVPRVVHAELGADYDAERSLSLFGTRSTDEIIFDDDELRDSMIRAGNVYLAMYGPLVAAGLTPEDRLERALAWLDASPAMSLASMRERGRSDIDGNDVESSDGVLVQAMLVSRLLKRFTLNLEAAVDQLAPLGVDRGAVEQAWRNAKEAAARRLSRDAWMGSGEGDEMHGGVDWLSFARRTLGDQEVDTLSPARTILLSAFRRAKAIRAVNGFDVTVKDRLHGPRLYDATFPLDKFARAAKGVGFVTHARATGDGVVRTLPLLARGRDRWYAQLGLAVGCDERGLTHATVASGGGRIDLSGDTDTLRVPLNADGQTVIAWHKPIRSGDWRHSFQHFSAAFVLQGSMTRESIEENERRIGLVIGKLLEERCRETPSELRVYEQVANERWQLRRKALRDPTRASLGTPAQTQRYQNLQSQQSKLEQEAFVWLERLHTLWSKETPQNDVERAQRDAVAALHAQLMTGDWLSRQEALNRDADLRSALADSELRRRVSGKICVVGYTASSVADLVTTPVFSSVPGVMAHANVINMVLGNQFVTVLSAFWHLLVLGVLGTLVSVVTARHGAIVSLFVTLLLTALLMASGVLLFRRGDWHLGTLPLVAVLGVVWTAVTVYRQFTEEHVRRSIERALSQYTSPAIASRVAQDANLRRLAPQPAQVTCFFSDLKGFTHLSERLGPARTRDVLNPYLETMSAVLIDHGAIVNKFMGDGIFAFFNAPIRPCINHQRSACDGALACHRALASLNAQQPGGEALRMRIGIASGEVFVGDYGSDSKLDYTCIGDCVNLAARLEKANKVLGTSTLVDSAAATAHPSARAIGRWRVSGRAGLVELFELRTALNDPHDSDGDALWKTVITEFQSRRWQSCRASLDRYLAKSADDSVAKAYLRAIAQFESIPPRDDWDGAIDIPLS